MSNYRVFSYSEQLAERLELSAALQKELRNCRGNPCAVELTSEEQPLETGRRAGAECFIWPLSTASTEPISKTSSKIISKINEGASADPKTSSASLLGIRVFNNAVETQLCIHGSLAASHHWMQRAEITSLALQMGQTPINCQRIAAWPPNQQLISAKLYPAQLFNTELPSWLAGLGAGAQPLQAAQSLNDDGYLLIEYQPDSDLAKLLPFTTNMQPKQLRSVILVSPQPALSSPDRMALRMRYFAPQHGSPEDSATGSAAAVVARYFADRGRAESLLIHQQSEAGGLLLCDVHEPQISVSGLSVAITPPKLL